MKIEIQKPDMKELEKKGVTSWPIWEKEISRFNWRYDCIEECYLLEGKVVVKTEDGKSVEFGKGDFVIFTYKPGLKKVISFPESNAESSSSSFVILRA